jgi:hypothetical protein
MGIALISGTCGWEFLKFFFYISGLPLSQPQLLGIVAKQTIANQELLYFCFVFLKFDGGSYCKGREVVRGPQAAICSSLLYSIEWLFLYNREGLLFTVRYELENMILVNLSLQIELSPVRIIPSVLHTHLRVFAAHTRMTNGRSLRTFRRNALSEIGGELDRKGLSFSL